MRINLLSYFIFGERISVFKHYDIFHGLLFCLHELRINGALPQTLESRENDDGLTWLYSQTRFSSQFLFSNFPFQNSNPPFSEISIVTPHQSSIFLRPRPNIYYQGHWRPRSPHTFLVFLFHFRSHFSATKLIFFFKKKIALSGVKPQWKATIDFKWIKDNKEAVAANLKNRNSDADLNLVLHLYDKMFTLQKVMLCYVSLRSFSSFSYNQFWINSNLICTL